MNKTQKIIVVLLVMAILFSATSIFISVGVSKLDYSDGVSGRAVSNGGNGGIVFVVEGNREQTG